MKTTLKSRLRDVCAHPLGRDVIDKLLLQTGKPAWLVRNPVVGSLKLGTIKKLVGGRVGAGFFDALISLLNSETDVPDDSPGKDAPAWWKEAVFYQVYPRTFSGEGLRGILSRLDLLRELGVDALWLSPVYDSPNDDNGYDIRDYRKIMREFGDMDDMDALIAGLHERGMKLVMDLVVNHTSDEHRWFRSALEDENSPFRDFYFFRDADGGEKPPNNWTSFFGGPAWNLYAERNVWALHLFSKKQMDLNWECAAMREEVCAMVRWWLEKGVDGFRLDVVNYISKVPGLPDGDPFIGALMEYTGVEHYFCGPGLHKHLRELRAVAFDPYGAFSVGETPGIGVRVGRLLTDDYRRELDLIFSFDHLEMPGRTRFEDYRYELSYLKRFYVTHLNEDRGHGWNTLFYNNHDNPRMLSKIDPEGEHSEPLARLLAILQLTLRGTPFLYQGDEIGMKNGNFASIDEIRDVESLGLYAELVKTVPPGEAFKRVLAGTRDHARIPLPWDETDRQRGDADSLWNFYKNLIALRRRSRALVYGKLDFLRPGDKTLLAYTRSLDGERFHVEANLGTGRRRGLAPPGAKLLACGYPDAPASAVLRPYEARVYRIKG